MDNLENFNNEEDDKKGDELIPEEEVKKIIKKTRKFTEEEGTEYDGIMQAYKELKEEYGDEFSDIDNKKQTELVDKKTEEIKERLKKEIDDMTS